MPDYSVDMINFVVDQKPNEFVNSFNAQMQQKVTDIVTGYKAELAKGYLAPKEPKEEQQETEVTSDEDSETNT
jgi:hypothetical protein